MRKYWSLARQTFFSQRNIEFVYLKNMPLELILYSFPQRLAYEIGSAVYFLKAGAGGAFFKGKIDVIRHLPGVLRKRRQVQRKKTVTNTQLRSAMEKSGFRLKWKKLLSAWRVPSITPEAKRP